MKTNTPQSDPNYDADGFRIKSEGGKRIIQGRRPANIRTAQDKAPAAEQSPTTTSTNVADTGTTSVK